jgi:hypothetical protein
MGFCLAINDFGIFISDVRLDLKMVSLMEPWGWASRLESLSLDGDCCFWDGCLAADTFVGLSSARASYCFLIHASFLNFGFLEQEGKNIECNSLSQPTVSPSFYWKGASSIRW